VFYFMMPQSRYNAGAKRPLAVDCRERVLGSGSSRDWAAKGPRLLGIRVRLLLYDAAIAL
ncbi:hypothetical protein CQA14_26845, partial [Escherichia coli]